MFLWVRLSKRKAWKDFQVNLSFLGWFLVCSIRKFYKIFSWSLLWTTIMVHDIWKKPDIPKMKQAAQSFLTSFLAGNSVSTLVDFLWKEFKKACHKLCPQKYIFSVSHNRYPWISHHIQQLSHRKQHLYNFANLSQSHNSWQAYHRGMSSSLYKLCIFFSK